MPACRRRGRAAHSRGRSRSRAPAPRAAGPCPCRSSARTSHVLPWSMWPAVPTVSGMHGPRRRPRRARRRRACGSRAAAGRRGRCRSPACSRNRSAVGELLFDRAGERRELGERQRAAADASHRLLDRRRRSASTRRSARARTSAESSCSIRSTGTSCRARAGSRYSSSVPSSAARPSLSMRSARCSGCRRRRSTRSARPTTMPACGPPSSLSPLKQTRSAPSASEPRAVGSSPTSTKTPEPRSSRSGSSRAPGDGGELLQRRALGEADDAEVRLVDAQQQRGVRGHGRVVVGGARAIRRPDLDEARTRACEHVGDAEAVADLDQLAARDEHVAALRERGEREQHRRRVVVDDDRRLGAGEPAQERCHVILPRAARSRPTGRTRGSSSRGRPRPPARSPPAAERCAAEVRVDDHAGRVQHAAQGRAARAGQLGREPRGEVARVERRPGSPPAPARGRRVRRRPRAGRRCAGRARRRRAGRAAPRSARYARGNRCKWALRRPAGVAASLSG